MAIGFESRSSIRPPNEKPVVGVVIVSYNAALAVRTTLASLRQTKNVTKYKVILIDNASDDLEREDIHSAFIRHVQEASLSWEYIQQDRNLGFSGGNNVGITRFLEDPEISHICLLNGDVIVTDFWLDALIDARCDIVSAVTNKADSEQCVPVDYTLELGECLDEITEKISPGPLARINAFAGDWRAAWKGNLVEVDVTFFCVLIAIPVIEKLGLLDEIFFPGGYEDDDYCLRAREHGYVVHLAREVFIHHWGSASFGQLQHEYFNERAQKNRDYLEKKHGITWRRRPEKPFVSYLMDIRFACVCAGNSVLRRRFNDLYRVQMGDLLACYVSEFIKLRSMVAESGLDSIPSLDIQMELADGFQGLNGNLKQIFAVADSFFSPGSHTNVKHKDIIARLEYLAEGVHVLANCNLAMYEYLSVHLKEAELKSLMAVGGRSRLTKAFHLLTKGMQFLWNLRGIVFFGGYPYPERQSDGYFQRIQIVDGLFSDCWRVYVESDELSGRDRWFDRPQPKVLVLRIIGARWRRALIRIFALVAALKCRKIYFHSVLRMHDNRFGWLMHVPGLTRVIDIHGVVPEEFRFHNDFYSGVLYDRVERLAVRKSDMVIVVTESMRAYLRQKYRENLRGQVAVFPMFPKVSPTLASRVYIDGNPVVVYAGGLHKWQQVPKMIDAISRTVSICAYRFYCPDPEAVRAMLPESVVGQVIVERKSHEELIRHYAECHYGFILREDIVVNRVACPTKLVEYLAMGIVPIVDCEDIGDFKSMGMRFVTLSDLLRGNLPAEALRGEMARANFAIYERLREVRKQGAKEIHSLLTTGPEERRVRPKGSKGLFPSHTYRGRLARFLWRFLRGVVPRSNDPGVGIDAEIAVDSSVPRECDVLVQVDNFEAGGLENVALDLNVMLIDAGYKLVFLVLGKAGEGVERARKLGIPVVMGSPENRSYQALIDRLGPRLVLTHYSLHGAELCNGRGIPFVQIIHNTYMWFDDAQRVEFANAARFTTVFVAVSEYAKCYSVRRLGIDEARCIVIPNGIDGAAFDSFDASVVRPEIRAKHGLSDEDFVFLSVGSINHQKNHIAAVRAFKTVSEKVAAAKLVILGPAYEKSLLDEIKNYVAEQGLAGRVIYAGAVSGAHRYYLMADAFVTAAFFEGGPLNQLEAIRANLPSVMANIGFASYFEGLQGVEIVSPPVDIAEFRGSINELVSDPTFVGRLAAAMVRIFSVGQRPDLDPAVLNALDKSFAYQCYVDLVDDLLQGRDVGGKSFPNSWPHRLSAMRSECAHVTV